MKKAIIFVLIALSLLARASEPVVLDTDVMQDSKSEVNLNALQKACALAILAKSDQSDYLKKFKEQVYDTCEYIGFDEGKKGFDVLLFDKCEKAFDVLLPAYMSHLMAMNDRNVSADDVVRELVNMSGRQEFLAYLYDIQENEDTKKASGITTMQYADRRIGFQGRMTPLIGSAMREYVLDGKVFYRARPSAGPAPHLRGRWNEFKKEVEILRSRMR